MEPRTIRQLEQALQGLAYGSVQLVIHEGRIVRIERVERIRLPAAQPSEKLGAGQAGLTGPPEASPQ